MFVFLIIIVQIVCSKVFNIKDYGAVGDGKTLDTKAIRDTFHAAEQAGGGTVLVPSGGRYLTAPFNLTSNLEFHIEEGAVILGVDDYDLFPVIAPLPSYGRARDKGTHCRFQSIVFGYRVKNVRITGGGEIDGQGKYWWDLKKKGSYPYGRPRLIEFAWSQNIEIDNVVLRNSPFWTLHPVYCHNVHIHDLKIRNPIDSPETDGIDPDSSSNVLIERVDIEVGDDFVAIKSGMDEAGLRYNMPSRNITIRDSTFQGQGAISIGSETSGSVYDVFVSNCVIPFGVAGVGIKSGRGRGGIVSNIHYENIEVIFSVGVMGIDMYYNHVPPTQNKTTTPIIKDIFYTNITGTDGALNGAFQCLPESPCTGITMKNVQSKSIMGGYNCEYAHGTQINVNPKACLISNNMKSNKRN